MHYVYTSSYYLMCSTVMSMHFVLANVPGIFQFGDANDCV